MSGCPGGRLGNTEAPYTVQCNVIYTGTLIGSPVAFINLDQCTQACTGREQCVAVSAVNGSCSLWSNPGTPRADAQGQAAWDSLLTGDSGAPSSSSSATSSTSTATAIPASSSGASSSAASSQTSSMVSPDATVVSATATTSPSRKVTDNGVSAGARAGAAVGAAIFGAAIALLIAFCLWGRKRRNMKSAAFISEKTLPQHPWDAYLPQSADDQTISRSVQTLFSQIDLHVENYYSNIATTGLSDIVNENLAKVNSGELPSHVKVMLVETTTPLPIIKHSFAWYILSKLTPSVSGEVSLLPAEFGSFASQAGWFWSW